MIRRPPRSTLSSSSAASDVYKRQTPARAESSGLPSIPTRMGPDPCGQPEERERNAKRHRAVPYRAGGEPERQPGEVRKPPPPAQVAPRYQEPVALVDDPPLGFGFPADRGAVTVHDRRAGRHDRRADALAHPQRKLHVLPEVGRQPLVEPSEAHEVASSQGERRPAQVRHRRVAAAGERQLPRLQDAVVPHEPRAALAASERLAHDAVSYTHL